MPFASRSWMKKRARGCFFSEQAHQHLILPKDQEAEFQRCILSIDAHHDGEHTPQNFWGRWRRRPLPQISLFSEIVRRERKALVYLIKDFIQCGLFTNTDVYDVLDRIRLPRLPSTAFP